MYQQLVRWALVAVVCPFTLFAETAPPAQGWFPPLKPDPTPLPRSEGQIVVSVQAGAAAVGVKDWQVGTAEMIIRTKVVDGMINEPPRVTESGRFRVHTRLIPQEPSEMDLEIGGVPVVLEAKVIGTTRGGVVGTGASLAASAMGGSLKTIRIPILLVPLVLEREEEPYLDDFAGVCVFQTEPSEVPSSRIIQQRRENNGLHSCVLLHEDHGLEKPELKAVTDMLQEIEKRMRTRLEKRLK